MSFSFSNFLKWTQHCWEWEQGDSLHFLFQHCISARERRGRWFNESWVESIFTRWFNYDCDCSEMSQNSSSISGEQWKTFMHCDLHKYACNVSWFFFLRFLSIVRKTSITKWIKVFRKNFANGLMCLRSLTALHFNLMYTSSI